MATRSKDEGITMADVSALNGTDTSPDETPVYVPSGDANDPIEAKFEDGDGVPFVSEGMRHDLFMYGRAVDPNTGRMVVRA